MSDNTITKVTANQDGTSTAITENGKVYTVPAGYPIVLVAGEEMIIDANTGIVEGVQELVAGIVEAVPTVTTVSLSEALIAIAAQSVTYTGVTFASGAVVSVTDLGSPVTLNVAPVV